MPKAIFHGKRLEQALYEKYFRAAEWYRNLGKIEPLARREAVRAGLGAMDALHLAAAHLAGADELVTTERPSRPVYRTALVRIVYLFG